MKCQAIELSQKEQNKLSGQQGYCVVWVQHRLDLVTRWVT